MTAAATGLPTANKTPSKVRVVPTVPNAVNKLSSNMTDPSGQGSWLANTLSSRNGARWLMTGALGREAFLRELLVLGRRLDGPRVRFTSSAH